MTGFKPGRAKLRVGLAGVGAMGSIHLRALLLRDDVELAAVADPDEQALDRAVSMVEKAGRCRPRVFADSDAMVVDEQLDAVVIATPARCHGRNAVAALESGSAVLLEKPLAATVEEGHAVVEAAASTGGLAQVGHIERFNPAIAVAIAAVRDGVLGSVLGVQAVRHGPMPERRRDVGVALDLAIHDVDLICHIIARDPIRVYARTPHAGAANYDEQLAGVLVFASGAIGQLDVSWLATEKHRQIVVRCEDGLIEVDCINQRVTLARSGGRSHRLPVERAQPVALEQDAFFAALINGGPPAVSAEEGLRALQVVELLLASAATGLAQPVAPLVLGRRLASVAAPTAI